MTKSFNFPFSIFHFSLTCVIVLTIKTSSVFSQDISKKYFQQKVNYEITVKLDDSRNELSAREIIQYINNSPDTLDYLCFHLWPNAYSNNKTPLAKQLMHRDGRQKLFKSDYAAGYIDSLNFMTGKKRLKWYYMDSSHEICRIELSQRLQPGDTVLITTPFHVKIPGGISSRAGHTGQSYQVSQWYPKPAVYDRSGWHTMPYLDQGEFYSEFGNFDVRITLPSDYTVAATGELQDSDEIKRINRISVNASSFFMPVQNEDGPAASGKMKTLRYTREDIHDFAWFADKKFRVMKGSVILPGSGKEVTTIVMFKDEQAYLWLDALNYSNRAILSFSGWIGDYPYKTFTAVQTSLASGSGMEYPGLAVIGFADDAYSLDEVIAHEICHNWFFSAVGSDERTYPYMDEGITSAYESRYMEKYYKGKKLWEVYFRNPKLAKFFDIKRLPVQRMSEIEWLIQARNNLEQRINLPAKEFTETNYGNIVYFKAGEGFNHLRRYLGDHLFDSVMHNYYLRWNMKHPYPADLKEVFSTGVTVNTDWFFQDYLGSVKRIDYKIAGLHNGNLIIKNKGEMSPPFMISFISGDSITGNIWSTGFTGKKYIPLSGFNYNRVQINADHSIPEINHLNNNLRTTGFFRKSSPVHPQLFYAFEDPDRRSLVYMPLVNWNRVDGFMAGVAINNGTLLPKPIEYSLLPFYSFRRNDLTGRGRISMNLTPYWNLIRKASLSFEGNVFGVSLFQNYLMTKTGLDVYFRNRQMYNQLSHRSFVNFITAPELSNIWQTEKKSVAQFFWQVGYVLERQSVVDPFNVITSFETGSSYSKLLAESNYRISYYGKNNGLDIRLFSGVVLRKNPGLSYYGIAPSGRSGRELYLYNGDFPDRFTSFPRNTLSRQMVINEGGLVSALNDSVGFSDWLISASFSSSLPGNAGKIPVKPFINVLYGGRAGKSDFYYEAGLKAGDTGLFEIYIPFFVSGNINNAWPTIRDRIRFVLNLSAFHPLRTAMGRTD